MEAALETEEVNEMEVLEVSADSLLGRMPGAVWKGRSRGAGEGRVLKTNCEGVVDEVVAR